MISKPIGIIYSPFKDKIKTPIQPSRSVASGRVKVFKQYARGLQNIEEFSHIVLLYKFHKSRGYRLTVTPFLDKTPKGLFATRYPRRPNQLGMSIVRLIKRKGNILYVKHVDVISGTPLLDIKPYVPDFIARGKVRIGWLSKKVR
jgi:tRNA-Thr(GGU) m(6)t(6)A37 methyltransferase TsaA